jgi:hypothetical protein
VFGDGDCGQLGLGEEVTERLRPFPVSVDGKKVASCAPRVTTAYLVLPGHCQSQSKSQCASFHVCIAPLLGCAGAANSVRRHAHRRPHRRPRALLLGGERRGRAGPGNWCAGRGWLAARLLRCCCSADHTRQPAPPNAHGLLPRPAPLPAAGELWEKSGQASGKPGDAYVPGKVALPKEAGKPLQISAGGWRCRSLVAVRLGGRQGASAAPQHAWPARWCASLPKEDCECRQAAHQTWSCGWGPTLLLSHMQRC